MYLMGFQIFAELFHGKVYPDCWISRSSSGTLLSQSNYRFDLPRDSGMLDVREILGCWMWA